MRRKASEDFGRAQRLDQVVHSRAKDVVLVLAAVTISYASTAKTVNPRC
jgi:hypothetical protein